MKHFNIYSDEAGGISIHKVLDWIIVQINADTLHLFSATILVLGKSVHESMNHSVKLSNKPLCYK